MVDFLERWSERTKVPVTTLLGWLGLGRSKFYDWRKRYGKVNEHNGKVPRDFWLEKWEKEAIVKFHLENPVEGYRRLAYMMIDENIVAVSPSSVYRVLKFEGLIQRFRGKKSSKGKGFNQPSEPHKHWHVDITYLNICGTFYYFCGILDGYSRYMVHWEIRESMTESDVETIVLRAKEKFEGIGPRIISDNGPQFTARDFKEFVRLCGMTHVKTSPYYPQSNGKFERWNKTLKAECIRPKTPLSLEEARRIVAEFVDHYNNRRLHSGIGYVTPKDMLEGRAKKIHRERDQKLEEARAARKVKRQQHRRA